MLENIPNLSKLTLKNILILILLLNISSKFSNIANTQLAENSLIKPMINNLSNKNMSNIIDSFKLPNLCLKKLLTLLVNIINFILLIILSFFIFKKLKICTFDYKIIDMTNDKDINKFNELKTPTLSYKINKKKKKDKKCKKEKKNLKEKKVDVYDIDKTINDINKFNNIKNELDNELDNEINVKSDNLDSESDSNYTDRDLK